MSPPNEAESALYADITGLLQGMRDASYAAVEAAVEQRFQAFLRVHRAGASASLEITQTMTVHDDAEPWAIYRTEYRIKPAEPPAAATESDAAWEAATGNVIPFPMAFGRHHLRPVAAPVQPARPVRTT
ncbi:MAG: hypothetical protein U1E66_05140 [Rhodospirillales bacterium]